MLAGYALFPLCVHMCTRALESGRGRDWLAFVLFFAVYPLVSQHWAYMAALFLVALVVMHFSLHPKKLPELPLRKILQWGAGAVVVLGLVNTVWLFSFFAPTAPFVAISQTDFAAYQTKTDATVGVFGNVLALYGFWNTDFRLPKDTLPYWFALAAAIFALAATGAYLSCKKRELLGTTLTLTFVPVLLLAVGFASHATRPLTLFLYYHLPGFKGLRETDKLTGLLAFAYAYLAAMGARQAAQVLARHTIGIPASVVKKIVFVSLVAIPFLTVYTMFNGFDRQITPADYPASWYQANALLQSDTSKGNVLFLPWWGYLRFPFAHDVLVANPAVNFFDAHILAAARYENRHMPLVQTPLDAAIAKAIDGTLAPDAFVDYLRTQHVTHILLAQEEDTKKYNFLFAAVKLKKALDTGDLVLFSLPN